MLGKLLLTVAIIVLAFSAIRQRAAERRSGGADEGAAARRPDAGGLLRRPKLAQDFVCAAVEPAACLGRNGGRHEICDERMDDAHLRAIELHQRSASQLVEARQLLVPRNGAQRVQIAGPAEHCG